MNVQRVAKILSNQDDMTVRTVVLDKAQKDKQIIYGARAYNAQAPDNLKKKTTDYDILTNNPRKSAKEVAETLTRRTGRPTEVIKGVHKGTYRVKLNGEVVADYTQSKGKIGTKKSWGNEYRSLKSIKRNATRLSNNPKLEYRRDKDLDTLSKIKEIERIESIF